MSLSSDFISAQCVDRLPSWVVSVSQWIHVHLKLQVRAEQNAWVLHICRQINSARATATEVNQ